MKSFELQLGSERGLQKVHSGRDVNKEIDTERTTTKPTELNYMSESTAPFAHLAGACVSLYIEISDISFHSISLLLRLLSPERKK